MDYAKYISFKTDAKLLAIPSSLATHVYASPKIHALEPIKELGYKMTIDGNPAHLTFIDINLLSYLFPNKQRLVFSGFGDIMAFINARNDWKDSAKKGNERYSIFVDESIDLVIKTLENINIAEPLDNWISEYIFIQCLLCHITDWVGSAPASGAEHLFAKCIEDEVSEEPLHGEVVALGVLIFCYIRKKDVNLVRHLLDKF
jgi:glycerol dehydrogenase-like iron-containing ADH family enzyme